MLLLTASDTAVTTPAQSMGTLTLIVAIALSCVVIGAIFLSAYLIRLKVYQLLQGNNTFRAISYVAEPIFAFGAGIVVAFFDLWKSATWINPSASLAIAMPSALGIFAMAIAFKALAAASKEKEKKIIESLEGEKLTLLKTVEQLESANNFSTRTRSYIRVIIDAKMDRMAKSVVQPALTAQQYVDALDSREQLQFIILMIHEFFSKDLGHGAKLRAGVYLRDQDDPMSLVPAYSWDGESRNCFHPESIQHMRLDDPQVKSLIVQTFRSESPLLVVGSCKEECMKGQFSFLRVEQEEYLKSMVAYKYLWDRNLQNGKKDAIILTLDTDQDGFFDRYDREQMANFFFEMLTRFEFELIGLTAQEMIKNQGNPPEIA